MKNFIKVICVMMLIGGAILSGCSFSGENATVSSTVSTATTATLSPSSTYVGEEGTPSPSIVATITPPSSPVITKSPVVPPTTTWVPALSEIEAENMVIDLLRDNGSCRLPCFWGFVPGQTSQQTIKSFFYSFYDIGGPNINIPRNDSTIKIFVNWNTDEKPNAVVRLLWVNMAAKREVKLADGKYDQNIFDNPYFPQYIQYYTLSNLLSIYGLPSKAYIGIDLGAEMGFDNLFHLYLNYSESGWSVQFIMPLKQENHSFIGCPAKAFTSLSLWSPEDTASATENQAWVDEYGIFKPFEEATDLSLEGFYQRFKDFDNTKCLETPVDIWLAPK